MPEPHLDSQLEARTSKFKANALDEPNEAFAKQCLAQQPLIQDNYLSSDKLVGDLPGVAFSRRPVATTILPSQQDFCLALDVSAVWDT